MNCKLESDLVGISSRSMDVEKGSLLCTHRRRLFGLAACSRPEFSVAVAVFFFARTLWNAWCIRGAEICLPYHCGVCTKEAIIRYSLEVTFKWYDNVILTSCPIARHAPIFQSSDERNKFRRSDTGNGRIDSLPCNSIELHYW
jgi:hypothetical protein